MPKFLLPQLVNLLEKSATVQTVRHAVRLKVHVLRVHNT